MTQNCQTLVPDPMLAPCVCAEGWICFFRTFCTATAVSLLRVLKSNALFLPEYADALIRPDRCPSRDVCQAQNVSIAGPIGFMNYPAGRGSDRKSTRLNSSHRCISY